MSCACFFSTLIAEQSEPHSEVNAHESAQEHFDKAKDHLIEFGLESIAAGTSAAHGPLGLAISVYELTQAVKSLIEAAEEYNEGRRIETELSSSNREKNGCDRPHDHDTWDREY